MNKEMALRLRLATRKPTCGYASYPRALLQRARTRMNGEKTESWWRRLLQRMRKN